jgi:hypothetical protein
MPNSNPSRNAKYLSNAQLCHAFSPKNHPLDRAKTHFFTAELVAKRQRPLHELVPKAVQQRLAAQKGSFQGWPRHVRMQANRRLKLPTK